METFLDIKDILDLELDPKYLEKLKIIELGALSGKVDDEQHFNDFFPAIEEFLTKVDEHSRNPNKTLNMNYLDYGIHVPEELGVEEEAIKSILPYYKCLDSRSGRDWRNVLPCTITPAVLGAYGAILVNPNLVTSKYSGRANELEIRVIKSIAKILGYKDLSKAGGLSLDGGTKANMYGYLFGLRKAFPQIKQKGLMSVKQEFKFINSQAGHFSNFTNLAAIGTGSDSAIRVPTNSQGIIDVQKFEEIFEDCAKNKIIVPTVLLTIGTTDSCAIDDVKGVYDVIESVIKEYPGTHRPHLHLDAAIGWAFSFFNNYDLEKNNLYFQESFLKGLSKIQNLMKDLHLADSITLDMHKTGFAPYSSSFLIVKDFNDFEYLKWDSSVFKYFDPEDYDISPVQYSLECTRSASGVFASALALSTLGIEGYQILLSAGLQHVHTLKEKFRSRKNIAILNDNIGFTCLFRPYPTFINKGQDLKNEEMFNASFYEKSQAISNYVHEFFKFWEKHKRPYAPNLDYVEAATWYKYQNTRNENDNDIPAWKAYMLNPRCGLFIESFLKEFLSLRMEFENQLPDEYLNKLKDELKDFC